MDGGWRLAGIVQDVTERAQQAAALKQANEALERSNMELQRFAYVASHDLQTPMRSIASFVGLLQTTYADKLDAQANDWIYRTVASIHSLQTLIRDLLDYSRVDAPGRAFEPVAFVTCSTTQSRSSLRRFVKQAAGHLRRPTDGQWRSFATGAADAKPHRQRPQVPRR